MGHIPVVEFFQKQGFQEAIPKPAKIMKPNQSLQSSIPAFRLNKKNMDPIQRDLRFVLQNHRGDSQLIAEVQQVPNLGKSYQFDILFGRITVNSVFVPFGHLPGTALQSSHQPDVWLRLYRCQYQPWPSCHCLD